MGSREHRFQVKMSVRNPSRLLDLAGKHLLRDDALAFSVLEDLPTELFPPLFMEAFHGRHIETLKAMVQAWPFVRLPLGGLIDMPHMGPLQAVLEALDGLLAQKVRSRKCKLQVLDLRNTGQNFWSMWSGASSYECSSSRMAPVAEQSSMAKQHLAPLNIFIDLCLKKRTLGNFLTYLLRWVEQRKASVHLCCKKLKISAMPMDNIVKVLSMVQLDCIQEVQVNWIWHLSTLATFASLLGKMSNLQRLRLSPIHLSAFTEQEQDHIAQITSQFLRLGHLQDLHLDYPSFLEGCLDQMLRCLKSPLDNLSITNCWLTESDLTHLSQSPNISQLKGLDLSGINMTDFNPELLHSLLEKVEGTLQELDLDLCGIKDSQLEAILPVLSLCSRLRYFSLCGNFLSMAVMEKLLRHTTGLPCLTQERYPAPQESYRSQGVLLEARLAQLRAQLLEILRDLGRPRVIWISPSPCLRCADVAIPQDDCEELGECKKQSSATN
ncbi:PRAME family member 8-like [Cervus elaphus]|uniref:PRAME family member 8-like n=1 Tax=Cervus elaphus TaxID=9860 RepID=UPI001CC2FFD2|nr:PRAME family member 8-like [Cervus elaphus]